MTDGALALELRLDEPEASFEPGARVTGVASWRRGRPPRAMELQLSWAATGWGGRDLKIVETVPLASPLPDERRPFIITLPDGPFTFQGALVALAWKLELVAQPGDEKASVVLVIGPGRRAVDLRR
ncbi:MAG TPA: hypothetical protein VH560_08620 [Polyangia bacterium]|jgi:hypothetical protein|nr:hypothetical protein [Polyangia bacterium]